MDGFMVGISLMTGITREIIICNSLLYKGVTAAMACITGEIPALGCIIGQVLCTNVGYMALHTSAFQCTLMILLMSCAGDTMTGSTGQVMPTDCLDNIRVSALMTGLTAVGCSASFPVNIMFLGQI